MRDKQGNEIVLYRAYQYVFAMPGPDVTTVIVESINDDGTCLCYDVCFNFKVNVSPEELFQPLTHGWTWDQISLIYDHGGELGCPTRGEIEEKLN